MKVPPKLTFGDDIIEPVREMADFGELESDTSEIVPSCVCNGIVFSRDCLMCDGPDCVQSENWFHAKCVGLSKSDFSFLSLTDKKWFCS